MVVPVYLSSCSVPGREVLCYALLDSQADSSFVSQTVTDSLGVVGEPVSMRLTTLNGKDKVANCYRFSDLIVRGFDAASPKIELPVTYTQEDIPFNRDHIPTAERARGWQHLLDVVNHLPPVQNCEVGLLIGYNCSEALLPLEVKQGNVAGEPFAVRTCLGWSIVGQADKFGRTMVEKHGFTHRVSLKVPEEVSLATKGLSESVQFVCNSEPKEVIAFPKILNLLEQDFHDTSNENETSKFSQEDYSFLSIMDHGCHKNAHGYYTMSLPFRDRKSLQLPNNYSCAQKRLHSLRKKLNQNPEMLDQYQSFMRDLMERGEAERVPDEEIDPGPGKVVWYLPHHGVFHPKKPGKLRVVYECSASFDGVSLKDKCCCRDQI